MVRQVKSWQTCMQLGIAAVAIVVTGDASAKAAPVASAPASALASCRSTSPVPPTSAEIEALHALTLKYKVAASETAVDKTPMSRCQFASLLSALSDRVNEVIASDTASGNTTRLFPKEEFLALQQLQTAYAIELAYYPSEFASNGEARTVTLERQVFKGNSPIALKVPITTKLSGEWILEPQFNEPPLLPLPLLPQNGNAHAALADLQALEALTARHGCIYGFVVPRTYQPTRFEFAAALNACLDRVEQLMAAGTVVNQADLGTLHRLETAYAVELAYLRRAVAQLEERTSRWEQQQAFEANLLATLKLPVIKFSSELILKSQPAPLQAEAAPAPPSVRLNNDTLPVADFWARYRQEATRAAALAAFNGQIDDFVEAKTPITMQLSTTTRFNSESLLKPQPTQLRPKSALASACIFGFSKSNIYEPEHIESADDRHVCIDQLEEQTGRQEQKPFSPTTKLHIETTLEISGTAGHNR